MHFGVLKEIPLRYGVLKRIPEFRSAKGYLKVGNHYYRGCSKTGLPYIGGGGGGSPLIIWETSRETS
jgi:hypothetical protein